MKVLHVIATYYPATAYGGPIHAVHQLVGALAAEGATVRVVTTDADGRKRLPMRAGRYGGVDVAYHRARPLNAYGVSPGLWADVARSASWADIIHLHGVHLPCTTVGLWVGRLSGTTTVVSPHGGLMRWPMQQHSGRKRIYGLIEKVPLRRALIHAMSNEEAEDARALGLPHVVMIPNGVELEAALDPGAVATDIRVDLGLPPGCRLVVWMGRFDKVKNLEVLLEATEGLGVELALAGNWQTEYGRGLRARVEQAGRKDVHFLAHLDGERKHALLQQAEVYAHPSIMESYGMSIAEALACGTRVVASTGTPWRELDPCGAGRWVAPTAVAFREAIGALLAEAPGPGRTAARALAVTQAWPLRARSMLEAYQRHLEGRTP